jgi:propionyl-CoA synthetase
VAECAVIGIQDELKGQILALVVTKSGDEIEQYQLNKK